MNVMTPSMPLSLPFLPSLPLRAAQWPRPDEGERPPLELILIIGGKRLAAPRSSGSQQPKLDTGKRLLKPVFLQRKWRDALYQCRSYIRPSF